MKKLMMIVVAFTLSAASANACAPELHCMIKYNNFSKADCKFLANTGKTLKQYVEDNMGTDDDGNPADLGEYANIPKVQAACKKVGVNLK